MLIAEGTKINKMRGLVILILCMFFLSARSTSLFSPDAVTPTFPVLSARGCLPENFSSSDTKPVVKICKPWTDNNGCPNSPRLAAFYVCMAIGLGPLNETSFDVQSFDARHSIYTTGDNWSARKLQLSRACQRSADARLSARQKAAFLFTCWKWSLYLDCDRRETDVLSGVASCRRAKFLTGTCPLSPRSLLDPFGHVTGRTWAECDRCIHPTVPAESEEDECRQKDADAIQCISCLLQDYNTSGVVDFGRLTSDIQNSGDEASTCQLLSIVKACSSSSVDTVDKFVTCWAYHGILSCAHSEANAVALGLEEDCPIPTVPYRS